EKAMAAQLDFCEGNEHYFKELPELVASGKISMTQLETATRDVLRTKILSGMIDGQPVVSAETRDCPAHRELVYESGLKSLVLLKNEKDILPLNPKIKTIALIGPNAANLPLDGHSSSAVIPSYTITVQQGIETLIGSNRVQYAKGCDINSTNRAGFAAAMEIARHADVVIFAGGLDNTVEGEEYFIKGDRLNGSVDLPGVQNELINEIAAVNPNVVLVVISGGTCAVNKVIQNVKGLLYAFYPGQEGGRAIANVLFGRENPSGKLPVTMPKNDSQLPPRNTDFRNVVTSGVGYRWFDRQKAEPEFAFGSGLSYTKFAYRRIRVTPEKAKAGQEIVVTVDVENTGKRSGEEVVQLYLASEKLDTQVAMPPKQLKGFARIQIAPGKTKRVTFRPSPEDLYVFDADRSRYFVPAGNYRVMVGGASDQLPLTGSFSLRPTAERPDLQVANIRTIPAFPKAGDQVIFVASILNRGTGPTPAGSIPHVDFKVDGQLAAVADGGFKSIPAGGMVMVSSRAAALKRSPWTAHDGHFRIIAEVNGGEAIPETTAANNSCEATLDLPGGKVLPSNL
ncbi:MAG: glycoside hydrolase family 3 C-terminal domain-containing protein, partial [Verrucomicrobiota bacterium]